MAAPTQTVAKTQSSVLSAQSFQALPQIAAAPQPPYRPSSYRYSTNDITAPSKPSTFGVDDSMT
jgi:hypothetical protein